MADNLILDPTTAAAAIQKEVLFTQAEAELLRAYKKLLLRHGLREALYCNQCWDHDLQDGCKAFVRDDRILIQCRCTTRAYAGQTF